MRKVTIFLLVPLLFWCCGYHLRGTGSSIPPHIKKINVPMFKNQTTRFQLDVKLTQSVIDELVARGKVEVAGESGDSDAVLIGEITSFYPRPITFSGATADRYALTVTAKIILRDLVSSKVIYSNPNFIYQEEYEVPEGADFETMETDAIDKIAEKFARSLIIEILEGF